MDESVDSHRMELRGLCRDSAGARQAARDGKRGHARFSDNKDENRICEAVGERLVVTAKAQFVQVPLEVDAMEDDRRFREIIELAVCELALFQPLDFVRRRVQALRSRMAGILLENIDRRGL